jgi:DNA polymerase
MLEDETLPLEVQACLLARVGAKSTIEETRSVTLFNLSQRVWGDGVQGWMPVPLKYYGAHTGRPSGDGGFNFTNFRRGSPIRDAITCDPDERIIHRDSSQIEARMVAWLADCETLLDAFRQGRDIYSEFASRFYGRKITKANVVERFVGKGCILGLGYGMGGPRLKRQLRIGSGGVSVDLTEDEAEVLKRFYRESYPEIPELWLRGEMVLSRIMVDPDDRLNPTFQRLGRASTNFGMPIKAITEGSEAIWLPNGLCINYPRLRYEWAPDGTSILYDGPRKQPKYLFGGKVVENICQALARIVITDVMVRTFQETGYHPILTTYDSLDYLVPASEAHAMDVYLAHAFARTPTWAVGLPLASEGGWGRTLAEAEKGVNA